MFSILVSAKDHFLTRYIFARAKQLCGVEGGREGGRFVFFFFFLISTALSHAPRCRAGEPHVRPGDSSPRRFMYSIALGSCFDRCFPKCFSEATGGHRTVEQTGASSRGRRTPGVRFSARTGPRGSGLCLQWLRGPHTDTERVGEAPAWLCPPPSHTHTHIHTYVKGHTCVCT